MSRRALAATIARLALLLPLTACGGTLDAGYDSPRGLLPVDERNPVIICNDGAYDGWLGEYGVIFAAAGKLELAGIVVNTSAQYSNLQSNAQGHQSLINAARESGMGDFSDPIASPSPALVRPASDDIDDTVPNGSPGSRFILDSARRLSRPLFPLAVVTGGSLTDVADAYLQDHSLADQLVVVAKLGAQSADGTGAIMSDPNGSLDRWADEIVARRFRYVQVSTSYVQTSDITAGLLATWPASPFNTWLSGKLPLADDTAVDQAAIFAVALPAFTLSVTRLSEAGTAPPTARQYPTLSPNPDGNAWFVNSADVPTAVAEVQRLLADPATYRH